MNKKRWLLALLALVAIGAITPSYVRAYRVHGASDAPSFLIGDRILVNKAAYDIRLPYAGIVLVPHSRPERGDVVMFRAPGEEYLVFKRVIGCPGDVIRMQDNRLEINGHRLDYENVDVAQFQAVATHNSLGQIVQREAGNGPSHLVTHTPGASTYATFERLQVPEDRYFVLGDNRDDSEDSRMYGAIPRRAIIGRVFRTLRPA